MDITDNNTYMITRTLYLTTLKPPRSGPLRYGDPYWCKAKLNMYSSYH